MNTVRFQKLTGLFSKHVWDLVAFTAFIAYFLGMAHGNAQILACFSLVVAAMVDGTLTRRILSTKLLTTFGICCYSIYLFHGLFLFSIRYTDWFVWLGAAPLSPDVQLLVGFLLTASVSYFFGLFSFKYLEQPCVGFAKKLVKNLKSTGEKSQPQ